MVGCEEGRINIGKDDVPYDRSKYFHLIYISNSDDISHGFACQQGIALVTC